MPWFFESDHPMMVQSGVLYLPLLFDPDIDRDVRRTSSGPSPGDRSTCTASPILIQVGRRFYVKTVTLQTIVDNYEALDRAGYENLREALLGKTEVDSSLKAVLPGGKLQIILLKILPHFVRKNRGAQRKRFSDEDVLDFLCDHLDIPQAYRKQAREVLDPRPLTQALARLEAVASAPGPPPEGSLSGPALRQWIVDGLKARIVMRERDRLQRELRRRGELGETQTRHLAALLFLADRGSFELDGFGFLRIGTRDEYLIYKRTGEYVLEDYYARRYRFPDCRVAVSTQGPLRPLVIERYKHPFLFGHTSNQEICMRGYDWPAEFSAENVIQVLEDGINALLFGYDARRRNGYHSLDPTLYYVKTIEFVDYRI